MIILKSIFKMIHYYSRNLLNTQKNMFRWEYNEAPEERISISKVNNVTLFEYWNAVKLLKSLCTNVRSCFTSQFVPFNFKHFLFIFCHLQYFCQDFKTKLMENFRTQHWPCNSCLVWLFKCFVLKLNTSKKKVFFSKICR